MASFVNKTALVGIVAAVITAVCTATPAQAATGSLVVTFQAPGSPNPYILNDVSDQTLTWSGDMTCLNVTVPAAANTWKATNNTDRSIAIYRGSDCQGSYFLHYIGRRGGTVSGPSCNPGDQFSFQPNP